MAKYRLIVLSDDNGENETVVFTEDFEAPPLDWAIQGQDVMSDTVIEVDLPSAFPLEYELNRS